MIVGSPSCWFWKNSKKQQQQQQQQQQHLPTLPYHKISPFDVFFFAQLYIYIYIHTYVRGRPAYLPTYLLVCVEKYITK